MIMVGSNIQGAADPLMKTEITYLYESLCHPKPEIATRISQLRVVRQMDAKLYTRAKKTLPYFVCGIFQPAVRRTENFAYTQYFVLDIDNLSERQIPMPDVRKRLESDARVVLLFTSPGEDGLKVLFRLKDRCHDAGLYSLFYKEFARRFSIQYGLEQAIDTRTSDVCRACFISVDPNAHYNPLAEEVDINAFLPTDNPLGMFDLKKDHEEKEKEIAKIQPKPDSSTEPEGDAMTRIREALRMKRESKPDVPRSPIYVPERLEEMMSGLCQYLEDAYQVTVYEQQNIQYGKKMKCRYGNRLAEINLFYGKHGFKVVQSPKATVSAELNEMVAEMIDCYIDENTRL